MDDFADAKCVRRAVIKGKSGTSVSNTIECYLPSNYVVKVVDGHTFIVGQDVAGWTLDGYVIPRLASGLIVADARLDHFQHYPATGLQG